MELTPEDIKKFRCIWLAEFGERISDERAQKEARRLLLLLKFAAESAFVKVETPPDKNNQIKN